MHEMMVWCTIREGKGWSGMLDTIKQCDTPVPIQQTKSVVIYDDEDRRGVGNMDGKKGSCKGIVKNPMLPMNSNKTNGLASVTTFILLPFLSGIWLASRIVFSPWRSLSRAKSVPLSALSYLRISRANVTSASNGTITLSKLSKQYSIALIFCWTSCNGSTASELLKLPLKYIPWSHVGEDIVVRRHGALNRWLVHTVGHKILHIVGMISDWVDPKRKSHNNERKYILENASWKWTDGNVMERNMPPRWRLYMIIFVFFVFC